MKLNKKQSAFLSNTISWWENSGDIPQELADKLRQTYTTKPFDFKRLAKYAFWFSIFFLVIAVLSFLADTVLIEFIQTFLSTSPIFLSLFFAILASIAYWIGVKRKNKWPEKIFSNEAIIFIGVLLTSTSIGFLGKALDTGSGHFALLFLLATIVYGILAFWLPSKLVWIFALISFGAWFGTETGYISGWEDYFLGLNYPLRYVLFGACLVGLSHLFRKKLTALGLFNSTYIIGMLYLFTALWLVSIFGNFGDMEAWKRINQITFIHWGVVSIIISIGAIYLGLKTDDTISRSFGIIFLMINIYTKYFEFLWNDLHKGIFFLILGISLWMIGQKAEKIWNMEFSKTGNSTKTD
jgi:hypothetical protein